MIASHQNQSRSNLLSRLLGCCGLLCLFVFLSPARGEELRVFILAGQSNMEGQGVVDLDHPRDYNSGRGNLVWSMEHSQSRDAMQHLRNSDGSWAERDDVFVRYRTEQELKRGPLSIGFAVYGGKHHMGPELQFGHIVGDHFDDPVLIIKTAWGGKSLFKDFRPPSSGGETGAYYHQMLKEVDEALKNLEQDFPGLAPNGYRIEAFVWFQGWNDMIDAKGRAEYADNLVNLASDLRKAWNLAALPIVIGETGNGGSDVDANMLMLRAAQAEAARRIVPAGSAVFVPTASFARPANDSPNTTHGHHWFGNAESYFLIGDALGRATVKLLTNH